MKGRSSHSSACNPESFHNLWNKSPTLAMEYKVLQDPAPPAPPVQFLIPFPCSLGSSHRGQLSAPHTRQELPCLRAFAPAAVALPSLEKPSLITSSERIPLSSSPSIFPCCVFFHITRHYPTQYHPLIYDMSPWLECKLEEGIDSVLFTVVWTGPRRFLGHRRHVIFVE